MIIYKAENKLNGKIYIGQTIQKLSYRITQHLNKSDKWYFGNALRKYGIENFEIKEIDKADNVEILNEKEKYYIYFYECKYPNGYNLTDGGYGTINLPEEIRQKMSEAQKGRKHSEKTKRKMSIWQKGKSKSKPTSKARQNMSEAQKGRKHSEETKKKISEAGKGRIVSEETRNKFSIAHKGKKISDEQKRKQSEAMKKRHKLKKEGKINNVRKK